MGGGVPQPGTGGIALQELYEVRGPEGRLLALFGQSSGVVPPIDPGILAGKGSLFLTRPSLVHHIASNDELRQRATELVDWIASGKLKLRPGENRRKRGEDLAQGKPALAAGRVAPKDVMDDITLTGDRDLGLRLLGAVHLLGASTGTATTTSPGAITSPCLSSVLTKSGDCAGTKPACASASSGAAESEKNSAQAESSRQSTAAHSRPVRNNRPLDRPETRAGEKITISLSTKDPARGMHYARKKHAVIPAAARAKATPATRASSS